MFLKKNINTKILSAVFVLFIVLSLITKSYADDREFELNCPYWFMTFNRAGYMDITYWYPSVRHDVLYEHEMCTGDWASACWYQGLGDEAEWLTNHFTIPSFYTQTPFVKQNYDVFNDPCNPVWDDPCQPTGYEPGSNYYSVGSTGNDTAWSTVKNTTDNKLLVTIYYEVVDLGEDSYSPMAFRDANDMPVYVKSERYVLLQTYVFENIHETEDINDLEFYQMLHGHPTGDGDLIANAMYETSALADSLANYQPYDANHQVGNFHYDITLWNVEAPSGEPNHIDWMGFSSTIEPNDYGFEQFTSSSSGMAEDIIEDRNLNELTEWAANEMAGAMMWYLGDIVPGQKKSITLALMFGTPPIYETPLSLTKTGYGTYYGIVQPYDPYFGNYLAYDICYNANGHADTNVVLTDYLPEDVNYYYCTGGGVYDSNTHTVTWDIGTMEAEDSNCFTLMVKVTEDAEPGSTLVNYCELQGDAIDVNVTETTIVDCYEGNILYVDDDANGGGDGLSWATAFNDLQDALDTARDSNCLNQIWVAAGTYKPVEDTNVTGYQNYSFELADGIALFGHFAGTENDASQRDFDDANNTTILLGEIESGQSVNKVVTADGVVDALLDGFTVKQASNSGIYISNDANVSLANCIIEDNSTYGICAANSVVADIHNCLFTRCSNSELSCSQGCTVTVTNTIFDGNSISPKGVYAQQDCGLNFSDCYFTNHTDMSFFSNGGTASIEDCNFTEPVLGANDKVLYLAYLTGTLSRCTIGSTSQQSGINGIYAYYCDSLIIENCSVSDCSGYGIYSYYGGNLVVKDSMVSNNGYGGIGAGGNAGSFLLERCLISGNTNYGAYIGYLGYNCQLLVNNNWVYENGIGITLYNRSSVAIVRNNTVANNNTYGIQHIPSIMGSTEPNVTNCIVWNNGTNLSSISSVNYCCIEGGYSGTGNINSDPCFADADANNFHLTPDSLCIDAGDPSFDDYNEIDIDEDPRLVDADKDGNSIVDIGADEFYWPDADYNQDEIVNFIDYTMLAGSWLTEDANYTLDDDNDVDVEDLVLFCEDWLWEAAWDNYGEMMFCMGGGGMDGGLMLDAVTSYELMPQSLSKKVDKFYALTPARTITALRNARQIEKPDIEEILKWLEELWLTEEDLSKNMTEADWLKFIESIKASLE